MATPRIDRSTCIGCGMCSALYEDVYGLDTATDKAFVQQDAPEQMDMIRLEETVTACPTGSITLDYNT